MFDGDYRGKRNINLGGNRGNQDKDALLRKAQQERQQRELERTKQRNIVKIQANWRRYNAVRKLKMQLRTDWDQLFATASTDTVASLLRMFLFFYHPFRDFQRLTVFSRWCLDCQINGSLNVLFSPLNSRSLNVDQVKIWKQNFVRFIRLLMKKFPVNEGLDESDPNKVSDFIQLVKNLLRFESFAQLQSEHFDGQKLYFEILESLVNAGFFKDLRTFILSIPMEKKSIPSLNAAIELLVLPFVALSQQPESLSPSFAKNLPVAFIFDILTIPLLPNRVSIDSITKLSSRMPFESILNILDHRENDQVERFIARELASRNVGDMDSISLLANILAFGHLRIGKMDLQTLTAYMGVLQTLLEALSPHTFASDSKSSNVLIKEALSSDSDTDSDSEDDVQQKDTFDVQQPKPDFMDLDSFQDPSSSTVSPTFPSPTAVFSEALFKNLVPKQQKWISLLCDPQHISTLIRTIISLHRTSSSSGFDSLSVVSTLSMLLTSVMSRWRSKKMDIMNTVLALSTSGECNLLKWIWETSLSTSSSVSQDWKSKMLLQNNPREHSTRMIIDAVLDSENYYRQWAVFTMFCEIFSRALMTMSDDEFFSAKVLPFDLKELISLTSMLRNVAFALHWNESSLPMRECIPGTLISLTYLKQIVTQLLQQLHAKDSRRQFCPQDFWLMTSELDMANFISLVVAEEEGVSVHDSSAQATSSAQSRHWFTGFRWRQAPPMAATNRTSPTSKTKIKVIGPRQALLRHIPFVIPFEQRVKIFREFVTVDKIREGLDAPIRTITPVANVTINRGRAFEDGYTYLNGLRSKLKGRIAIEFISEQGLPEAGIDGGGVFKEFLMSSTKEARNYGLFQFTKDQLLYPSPSRYAQEETQLNYFEFLGRILGKALYEGILVDINFAGFFLAKWLGKTSFLDDLPSLDPELYNGLIFLKNYSGDVSDLDLTFSVTEQEFGETRTIPLIPNGASIPVTSENRMRYIYLVAYYKLNTQIERQCKAFFRGLSDLISPKWLRMFNQQELTTLLSGTHLPINLDDLKQNMVYDGGYGLDHPTIIAFWRVLESFPEEDRRKFLKFVTSVERAPLLGFKELDPKMCIRMAGSEGSDIDRLPTASTCVNLLKMPAYHDEETLRNKLVYAINSGAGFELS